jgi:hypothetical protein
MRYASVANSWAVYEIAAKGKDLATRGVCDQGDWLEIEKTAAGRFTLVRGNITNEGEAERLARGTFGDTKPRIPKNYSPVVAQG